ncbi:hypothetical protein ACWENQ_08450 [Nonomuraea sp. NPDC004354]
MNDDEADTFLDTCTKQEMRSMLNILSGYEPKGFAFAADMIKQLRRAGANR